MFSARAANGVRLVVVSALFAALGVGCATAQPGDSAKAPSPAEAEEIDALVEGNTQFALDLYSNLSQGEGNLFFSPSSISSALAMTYAGARGDTAAEMQRVLHFPGAGESFDAAFHDLVAELDRRLNEDGNELNVANALWGQKGFEFLAEFIEITRKYYGAGLHEVDFVGAREEARRTINTWVEKETKGKIKDLIPPGVLNDQTRLVLTNAIYFFGRWAVEFEEKNTHESPFTLMSGEEAPVPMMNRTGEYGYMENEEMQALELPYADKAASMVILLPKEKTGLPDLEKKLTGENYGAWVKELRERKVVVAIPKFTMTNRFNLNSTLSSMGMKEAFSGNADFSGMTGKKDLAISDVIHKAFVDVSEKGTEAAAATAVMIELSAAIGQGPPVFRADHPFLFVIRDGKTGSILFMGRVMDPRG